jgi:hypothetical protein
VQLKREKVPWCSGLKSELDLGQIVIARADIDACANGEASRGARKWREAPRQARLITRYRAAVAGHAFSPALPPGHATIHVVATLAPAGPNAQGRVRLWEGARAGVSPPIRPHQASHWTATAMAKGTFTAHRETDFGRSETKGPNPLPDGLRFPQRPPTGHYSRPKPRENRGCSAKTRNSGLAQDCVVGLGGLEPETRRQRAFLINAHEAAVPSDIGRQDSREPSLYPLGGQGTPPLQGGTHDSTGAGGRLGGVRVPSPRNIGPAARWKRFAGLPIRSSKMIALSHASITLIEFEEARHWSLESLR